MSGDESRGGSRSTATAVGHRRELHIERLVAGGDALARDGDGRVVFINGALPGETIEAEFVEVKRDFARARMLRVASASPNRVTPPCRHVADGCGGCDWQHLAAHAQHDAKVAVVREAFARPARIPDAPIVRGGAVGHEASRTTIKFKLEASDVGQLLARIGYPDHVQGARGSLEGSLAWNGDPVTTCFRNSSHSTLKALS